MLAGSSRAQTDQPPDSTAYYDELFGELESFLDSILSPRTMFLVQVGVNHTWLNYQSKNDYELEVKRKILYTPSVGYYHKSGPGITVSGRVVNDGEKLNPYQLLVTGSYDYLKNMDFATGVSMTHILTKSELPFYTSPLQNTASLYFIYRKWWFKPSVVASYGWGSRSEYEERQDYITSLRLRPYGFTRVNTQENIEDFSVTTSVRHDFYWLDVLTDNNVIRVTPQISMTSGTQRFGWNQSSSSYGVSRTTGNSEMYSSENVYLDNQRSFQPISLSAMLKTEISFGKFFIQPQVMADYYLPAEKDNFTALFLFNTGVIF